jgi:type 1 fimbria pilin
MRHNRIRLLFAVSLLAAGLASASASAQHPYDGLWQVTVATKTGSCDAQTTSTLTVTDGKISGGPISGSVSTGGLVRVSINGAYANGQLSGNSGSGKWNGASAGVPCSGRWEASRR